MSTAISGGSRIRTNTPAENAYNALQASSNEIALRQLRLSTGKRINSAADDVAGYITSRSLTSRNGSLKSALNSAGDALSVTSMAQDALDTINSLITQIKDNAATASSGALGTDEKVALAKASYRLAEQVQFTVNSSIFGGKELLKGAFSGDWVIGYDYKNNILTLGIDLTTTNVTDFNISDASGFDLNATSASLSNFAGVTGLSMESLNSVSASDLGVFSSTNISSTLTSLANALNNVSKVSSYLGGIQVRLNSQEELLKSQITNYNAAISRISDADVAEEQLNLIKAQFLQQTSLISLTQANQTPQTFLQLFR